MPRNADSSARHSPLSTRRSRTATRQSSWLELWTAAEAEAVDAVAELFQWHGQGVAIEEPIVSAPDGEWTRIDPDRPVVVKTYLPVDEHAAERAERLEQGIWHLGRLRRVEPLQQRVLSEEDWAHAWKRYFFVHRVGRRIVIVPSWRRHRAQPDDVVIRLDPGMAFGTGLHPTTRLCLQALERYTRPGMRVLDLGTGSGVLAIAAARLGARQVLALDVEPVAASVADENARRNRVRRPVRVAEGSLPFADAGGAFDLVVANISRTVILALLGHIAASLAAGGTVILSGLLQEARDEVIEGAEGQGLVVLETMQEGDWIALVLR